MPDYKKMYAILCGAASDAIDLLHEGNSDGALALLSASVAEAEELYLDADNGGDAL